jgi:hypothetical protein
MRVRRVSFAPDGEYHHERGRLTQSRYPCLSSSLSSDYDGRRRSSLPDTFTFDVIEVDLERPR